MQEDENLLKDFEDAAYGSYCRTLDHHSIHGVGLTQWMEARKVSGGWVVKYKERCRDQDGQNTSFVKQTTAGKNLTFFEAVQMLAQYEQTALDMGWAASRDSDTGLSSTAPQYYRVFAEREGLAFDKDGAVYATDKGIILHDGVFAEDAYEKAEASYGNRIEFLRSQSLPELFFNKKDALEFHSHKNVIEQLERIMELFGSASLYIESEGLEYCAVEELVKGIEGQGCSIIANEKGTLAWEKVKDFFLSESNMEDSATSTQNIEKHLYLYAKYLYLVLSAALIQHTIDSVGVKPKKLMTEENKLNQLKKAEAILVSLGATTDIAEAYAFKTYMMVLNDYRERGHKIVPQVISEFLKKVNDLKDLYFSRYGISDTARAPKLSPKEIMKSLTF